MWLCGTSQRQEGHFQHLSPHLSAFRDLFNAAFVSCWSELNEDQQDELIRSIELALTSQDIAEVTQTLLNLAEFMEHSDKVSLSGSQLAGRGEAPHNPLWPVACLPFVSYAVGFCSPPGPPAFER